MKKVGLILLGVLLINSCKKKEPIRPNEMMMCVDDECCRLLIEGEWVPNLEKNKSPVPTLRYNSDSTYYIDDVFSSYYLIKDLHLSYYDTLWNETSKSEIIYINGSRCKIGGLAPMGRID